ncbi:MAG: hypothetical protein WCT36_02305 [Candidatus Gracilibacteria bacterium]|jgi:hypothetical protein
MNFSQALVFGGLAINALTGCGRTIEGVEKDCPEVMAVCDGVSMKCASALVSGECLGKENVQNGLKTDAFIACLVGKNIALIAVIAAAIPLILERRKKKAK